MWFWLGFFFLLGWVCSVARDRYFQFHSCKNGQRLGGYLCSAWCTALSYDEGAKYAFIGDYSGQITVCQLSENGVKLINVLKGHTGSIQSLCWDVSQGWLYSGNFLNIKTGANIFSFWRNPFRKSQKSWNNRSVEHMNGPGLFSTSRILS